MIRRIVTVIAAAVILCWAAAGEARAAGFQIGATYWYAWWEPMFKEWMLGTGMPFPRTVRDYSFEPASLAGPVIGIDFNRRVNLTAIFVTGKYRLRASLLEFNPLFGTFTPSHQDSGVDKYDLDAALNITMNRYVKILVGLKYQNYSYSKVSLLNVNTGSDNFIIYSEDKVTYNGLSAGIGAGFTFGLYGNLFMVWSLSARYQLPLINVKHKQILALGGSIVPGEDSVSPSYNSVGANSVLSLAYLMEDLSTTISLGFRYQYLYTFGKDSEYFFIAGKSDHFYGITVALVYAYQAPDKGTVKEDEAR